MLAQPLLLNSDNKVANIPGNGDRRYKIAILKGCSHLSNTKRQRKRNPEPAPIFARLNVMVNLKGNFVQVPHEYGELTRDSSTEVSDLCKQERVSLEGTKCVWRSPSSYMGERV